MTRPRRHHRCSWLDGAMLTFALAAATSPCGQQNAAAQVQVVNSIRLELRLQPQTGLPADPGGVVDVPGTAHLPITGPGQLRRFEVQYRMLDLDPADDVVPLSVGSFQFSISFTGGGNATLARAVLSRAEVTRNTAPAFSPDLSGQQTGASAPPREFAGMHFPFWRSAGPAPNYIPNNDGQENGIFAPGPGGPAQVLRSITPMRLSAEQPTQLGVWYGLYSFNFISGTSPVDDVTLHATLLVADTGNVFGFLVADDCVPRVSTNSATAPATIPIPAPVPSTLALGVLSILARRRR